MKTNGIVEVTLHAFLAQHIVKVNNQLSVLAPLPSHKESYTIIQLFRRWEPTSGLYPEPDESTPPISPYFFKLHFNIILCTNKLA
jgi:hypothetical protein